MAKKSQTHTEHSQPTIYQIRLEGHLNQRWQPSFEEFTISLEPDGTTCLSGPVIDQAALYGLLRKVRDLGMPLISVNRYIT